MDTVTFDRVLGRGETELHFLFDMRNQRYIRLVFEGEAPYAPMRAYPFLVAENGQNPDQFRARYEEAPAGPKPRPGRDPAVPGDAEDGLDDDDPDAGEGDDGEDRMFDGEEIYDEDEGLA